MSRNWAGSVSYTAPRILPASTIDEVRQALSGTGAVHALGTRHSFNDLPDTAGTLLDLSGLTGGFALDESARTVEVAAGTRYGLLAAWLEARGWALHNLGSLPHISVGGAAATGTHGSGDRNGVLTTAVRAIRYFDANGVLNEVTKQDPDFAAVAVGLGAYGVVVSLTLAIEPTYRVRQDIYQGMSWAAALSSFNEVTSAGYSVSIFTRWDSETIGDVWVKTRLDAHDGTAPATLLDGTRASDAKPLGGHSGLTALGGVPGPWAERLPHFRFDGQPSIGNEIQSEYFVAKDDAPAALKAVRELGTLLRSVLFVSEVRTAARDGLWLSGAYQRDIVCIHFTWLNNDRGVRAVLPTVEAALAPFMARPHWGKLHLFTAEEIARVHPRLVDSRAVFDRLDPGRRFANAHLERIGVR